MYGSKYTIVVLVAGETEAEWKGVGYIYSTCKTIFPKRQRKKPVEIGFLKLDADFSGFGEPCEYIGACGCINIATLPDYLDLSAIYPQKALKAEPNNFLYYPYG